MISCCLIVTRPTVYLSDSWSLNFCKIHILLQDVNVVKTEVESKDEDSKSLSDCHTDKAAKLSDEKKDELSDKVEDSVNDEKKDAVDGEKKESENNEKKDCGNDDKKDPATNAHEDLVKDVKGDPIKEAVVDKELLQVI